MITSSEYQFPIFISSTDYNLIDLRAELSRYLNEIGYRPILSSSDGFPDSSPKLEPWESCLSVLSHSFVMLLIIDYKYGTSLEWPNYKDIFNERKISPTHGEYYYAHKMNKRILVFIRKELLSFYQTYKNSIKNFKNEEEAKENLKKVLPEYIDIETLKFIHEIKTTKPIPWIKSFENVTNIKAEVQKKMLNELAEMFMIKNHYIETIIAVFNKVMDELTPQKQQEILEKINVTKEYKNLKEELEKKENELKVELEKAQKGNTKEREEKEKKIRELELQIKKLKKSESPSAFFEDPLFFNKDGKLRISGSAFASSSLINFPTSSSIVVSGSSLTSSLYKKKCDKCGEEIDNYLTNAVLWGGSNYCYSCGRNLCNKCWPKHISTYSTQCPDCSSRNSFMKV